MPLVARDLYLYLAMEKEAVVVPVLGTRPSGDEQSKTLSFASGFCLLSGQPAYISHLSQFCTYTKAQKHKSPTADSKVKKKRRRRRRLAIDIGHPSPPECSVIICVDRLALLFVNFSWKRKGISG
jgi:hypothetical protein